MYAFFVRVTKGYPEGLPIAYPSRHGGGNAWKRSGLKSQGKRDLRCVDTKMHAVEPLALALYIAHNDNVRVKVCQRCVRASWKKSRFHL